MSESEWRRFVLTGTRTGRLAVTRADGRPHVTPIWFDLDGDPYAYVLLEGTATLSTDPGELLAWAARIGGRYMGPDRATEYGERNGVPGEYLVRLRVERVHAFRGIAD